MNAQRSGKQIDVSLSLLLCVSKINKLKKIVGQKQNTAKRCQSASTMKTNSMDISWGLK